MFDDNRFELQIGELCIQVTRKKVKNINFRLGPNGEFLMSIPWQTSRKEAERVALEHVYWFERSKARYEARHSTSIEGWNSGDIINVWGNPTPLLVTSKEGPAENCELADGRLVVRKGDGPASRAQYVEAWLAQQLYRRIVDLLPACEGRVGCQATHITIRRMKTRWGSCSPASGRIRMNTALAECPPDCTELVLTHELCHLRVNNHGPQFKALMDLCYPSWRTAQRWLDEHPPRI